MGWLEVSSDRCFSGKIEELIRRLPPRGHRAPARADLQTGIDERYAANEIVSHSASAFLRTAFSRLLKSWKKLFARPRSLVPASTKLNSS